MSGAYSIFPLRLVIVTHFVTTNSRNALTIRPLAAGIAAVDRIRSLGGKFSHILCRPGFVVFPVAAVSNPSDIHGSLTDRNSNVSWC